MKIELNMPDDAGWGLSEFDLKMYLGVKLYEEGLMSAGLAAEILGIEYADFILNMGKYGKSVFYKSDEEIKKDSEVAGQFVR